MAQHDPARKRTILDGVMETSISRRTLAKGAAWSVPAIALAVAAPAASASPDVEVGAFTINGNDGGLGLIGPGFVLTAGSAALPAGTVITVVRGGGVELGVLSFSGGSATQLVGLNESTRIVTLTADLPAGQQLFIGWTVSISVAYSATASVALPDGYVGTGSKASGSLSCTLIFCTEG